MFDDFGQDDEFDDGNIACPACGHSPTRSRSCQICGGEGSREYNDAPEEWGEDCPSEANHLIECRECDSSGIERWCPKCSANYWLAKREADRKAKLAKR